MLFRLATLSCVVAVVTGFAPTTRIPTTTTTTTTTYSTVSTPTVTQHVSFPLSSTSLAAVMDSGSKASSSTSTSTDKIYKEKETPKVLGGINIGLRKLVVITGASSGLGLATAVSLAKKGNYFIVMACRDVEKAKKGT